MGLFIGGEKICGRNRLEKNISSEYSTLAVEDIDQTDKVMDILKEYVPVEKFTDMVDVLCACVNETKYAVFEQGFLRGLPWQRVVEFSVGCNDGANGYKS